MPLEDLTGSDKYLDALNKDWPLDDDDRPEGDDHIRGIKNVLLNTFGSLSAAYNVARARYWNTPAASQADSTGSTKPAIGTVAQRPAAPTTGDERWNTDVRPEGWAREQWYGGAWKQRVPCIDLENYWERTQYIDSRSDTVPLGNGYGIRWAPTYDAGQQFCRIIGQALSDDPGGQGHLRLGVRRNGVIGDVLTIDEVSGVVSVLPLTVEGTAVLRQNSVAYESAATAFSLGSVVTFTHGLGFRPKLYKAYLECATIDQGYAVGDEVEFGTTCATADTQNNFESAISTLVVDGDTEIKLVISATHIAIANKTNGSFQKINVASWRVKVRAWA